MFKDAREYATFLNACGRMERSDIGIGSLMNEKSAKKDAENVLKNYKSEIGIAINWLKDQLVKKEKIIIGNNYIIVDARGIVRASIVGTLASIASRMDEIKEGNLILTIASLDNEDLKASLRRKGNGDNDLNNLIHKISKESNSSSGGHENASGATIPKENYNLFIESAIRILEKE
jgi:single-stranded-DNA-specific exonuclease